MPTTQTNPIVHTTKIDIPVEARAELINILKQQMADNADLYSHSKQAHWNVKGMYFQQLHELFDKVAEAIEPFTDELAERIVTLGGVAMGTSKMVATTTSLEDYPEDIFNDQKHLEILTTHWAAYAASTRIAANRAGELGDPTTEDLFIQISGAVDLNLYFLESHLQG